MCSTLSSNKCIRCVPPDEGVRDDELLRLLGSVRMLGSSVDLQVRKQCASKLQRNTTRNASQTADGNIKPICINSWKNNLFKAPSFEIRYIACPQAPNNETDDVNVMPFPDH
jgi:hypothetical protein